jgi:hypothetical protein
MLREKILYDRVVLKGMDVYSYTPRQSYLCARGVYVGYGETAQL